ncbi:nucleotidyltransferase domain-containing protein [Candidatus Gottesmanbacteria bacterium]|nr:nucleotidyltransferase domain-containing protein [Candidatus Gottesmanbacteria bacterium]
MIALDNQKIADFCKNNNIVFLGLFGSAAREELHAGSDIDLLIRYGQPVGLFEHSRVAIELESLFGRQVDLVTERALNKYIKAHVYRDLKPLYGQRSS